MNTMRSLPFAVEAKRTFREWYYPYGIIMPKETTPETAVHGVTSEQIEHLVLANLTQQEATAKITYYFEDDAPIYRTHKVPPRGATIYRFGSLKDEAFPRRKLFGVKITSDVPIVPQSTQGGSENVPKPALPSNYESSVIAYPGPLGKKETRWMYPDAHPFLTKSPTGWHDWEWITILNPSPDKPANIRITFNFVDRLGTQKLHTLTVPPERIRHIALHELPLPVMKFADACYPIIESDVPVVVEQTRPPVVASNPGPRGGWNMIALPIGDIDFDVPVLKP